MFERRLDHADLMDAYKAHKATGAGTDREFLDKHPEVSAPHFYRLLKRWRDRATSGLDPLTGEQSPTAGAYLLAIDPDKRKPETPDRPGEEQADSIDPASIAARSILSQLPQAQLVYRRALKGKGRVSPLAFKAAQDVLKAAGQLQAKKDTTAQASEFTTWPAPALAALLADLAPGILTSKGTVTEAASLTPATVEATPEDRAPDGLPASI